jgi:hypothetical protein
VIIWHVSVDDIGVTHVARVIKISIGLEILLTGGRVRIMHDAQE